LLDVLPASAGKRQTIKYLMLQLDFNYLEPLFTVDSGDDIYIMSNRISSIRVANEDALDAAIKHVQASRQVCTFNIRHGYFIWMNGNYSAGILEGITHFIPQAEHWFRGNYESSN
jgi:hypothetical protein